jgi:peptide/nickel transport system substrate-binding protein
MQLRRWYCLAVVALLAIGLAAPSLAQGSPTSGGTLILATYAEPDGIDPHLTTTSQFIYDYWRTVYEPLLVLGPDGPMPWLAESWEFSADNTSLTLTLTDGVKFHNGRAMTATDVKWNLDRVLDASLGSPWRPQIAVIDSSEVVSSRVIRLHLRYATPTVLDGLTNLMIVASEMFAQNKPIGTGPFSYLEWIPGSNLTLMKFADYWQPGLPYLDAVKFLPVTDAQTRLALLESGNVHVVVTPDRKDLEQIESSANTQTIVSARGGNKSAYLNWDRWPFNNKLCRQAIEYCIDRNAFITNGLFGYAEPTVSLYDRVEWCYDPETENLGRQYNLTMAKALFKQAGYPRPGDGPLEILLLAGNPDIEMSAVQLQSALSQIGVPSRIVKQDNASWYNLLIGSRPRAFDFCYTWYTYGVRDPYFNLTTDLADETTNLSGFRIPGYTALAEQARSLFDQDARRIIYGAIQRLIIEENAFIILAHYAEVWGAANAVQGLEFDPTMTPLFLYAWLSK